MIMETFINRNYNIDIEIISSVHIGGGAEGNWLKGVDFIYDRDEGLVYRLNFKKLSQVIPPEKLSLGFLQPNERNIKSLIRSSRNNLGDVSDEIFELPLQPGTEIKTHIKDGKTGKPYIPGSSIKGALRSILFNYLRKKNEQTNEEVFGKITDGTDFMRFIRVGDAHFNRTMLMQTKIFNVFQNHTTWIGGWKHGFRNGTNEHFNDREFVTTYEALGNFEKASFRLGLADRLFAARNRSNNPQKADLISNGIEKLFNVINDHTKHYLEKERDFFVQYQTELSDKIIDNIDYLYGLFDRFPDCCLLKLASGSGFHSITGDWRFKDHLYTITTPDKANIRFNHKTKSKEPTRYKSRKLIFEYTDESDDPELIPMGFVMLSLNTSDE